MLADARDRACTRIFNLGDLGGFGADAFSEEERAGRYEIHRDDLLDILSAAIDGQVEILFTLLFSRFYLGEQPSRSEIGGALVLVLGVVLVLAGAIFSQRDQLGGFFRQVGAPVLVLNVATSEAFAQLWNTRVRK